MNFSDINFVLTCNVKSNKPLVLIKNALPAAKEYKLYVKAIETIFQILREAGAKVQTAISVNKTINIHDHPE